MARAKVPRAIFDYIAGGAEDEVTLRRNREACGRWALRPRVLRDVSKRDTKTVLLGERVSMPVCVGPTSFHALVHPEGARSRLRGGPRPRTRFSSPPRFRPIHSSRSPPRLTLLDDSSSLFSSTAPSLW